MPPIFRVSRMCRATTCLPAIPGFDMTGDKIASAARACIGTPFRPQGRLAGVGLDCIGLAAVAVRAGGTDVEPPSDYDLSGDCGSRLADALEALGLTRAATEIGRASVRERVCQSV